MVRGLYPANPPRSRRDVQVFGGDGRWGSLVHNPRTGAQHRTLHIAGIYMEEDMGLVIVLLVLALIFGGIGLFVEAAAWALIIALVLLVAGAIAGMMGRGRSTA
jgi:hypothetical protein